MNSKIKTKPQLETMLQDFAKLLADPNTKGIALMNCDNNPEIAQAFLESGEGLGIGAFAELAGVSVDTVRHWVELELVCPYSLNGKFKFTPPNLLELRSVQQWQGLGLSLEQIKIHKADRLGYVPTQAIEVNGEVIEVGYVQFIAGDDARVKDLTLWSQGILGKLRTQDLPPAFQNVISDVKADFDAQIEKLEQAKLELEEKISSAKALRARLDG